MAVFHELRVHGVSGTPPRQMLRTDPVTLDPTSRHIRIFSRVPPDRTSDDSGRTYEFEADAYHWGSLTTGHWLTALWILLGPFAFANVAGWMNTRPNRLTHAAVRLVGVALTALLVAQMGYPFLVVAPQLAPERWEPTALLVSAALLPFLFVWGLVMRLSTQSHFTRFGPGERIRLVLSPRPRHLLPRMLWSDPDPAVVAGQWDDPAGARIADEVTWSQHAIVHRLRRIHLAAGCGAVVALFASLTETRWLRLGALVLAATVITLTVATGWFARSQVVIRVTAALPLISIAMVVAGWVALVMERPEIRLGPEIHQTTFVVSLALAALTFAATTAGLAPMGAIVVGALFGASLGVGISLLAENAVGLDRITRYGAGWVAVAMFYLVLFMLGIAAVLALRRVDRDDERPDGLPEDGRALALARRVTMRSSHLLVATALFGIAVGVVAFVFGCLGPDCSPANLEPPSRDSRVYPATIAGMTVVAALISLVLAKVRRWVGVSAAVLLGGLVTLFAMQRLPSFRMSRLTIDLDDLVDLSKVLVVVLPTLLIARSMLGSIRRGTSNRQVGILWDIASMWPRWFHPLAPPAYGPMVIGDLAHRLVIHPPDLLEGHSQGSVLSVLAVSQMEEEPEDLALITYGSPIGLLYRPLFPSVGIDDLVRLVDVRLGGKWVNLWRETDPIGGAEIGLDDGDIPVRDGVGHSDYEISSDFAIARQSLV